MATRTKTQTQPAPKNVRSSKATKLPANVYRMLLVTSKGDFVANIFRATSLAKAAQEAVKSEYRRPWGATVLQRGTTGKRYCIADCVKLAGVAA